MEKIVIDSSVAIKWFVDEPKSKRALDLLAQHDQNKITIIVPDVIRLEIINGLFYSYHFGISQLKNTLNSLGSLELHFVSIDEIDMENAAFLMEKFTITSYDALFIALAQNIGCQLVTNDRKHHLKKYYSNIKYL